MGKSRIIPVYEVFNRPEKQKYIIEKYYIRERRALSVAIIWLITFGIFGFHRVYLKQYKEAAIVFFCVLASGVIPYLFILVLLAESMLLPISVSGSNERLRSQLEKEMFLNE